MLVRNLEFRERSAKGVHADPCSCPKAGAQLVDAHERCVWGTTGREELDAEYGDNVGGPPKTEGQASFLPCAASRALGLGLHVESVSSGGKQEESGDIGILSDKL